MKILNILIESENESLDNLSTRSLQLKLKQLSDILNRRKQWLIALPEYNLISVRTQNALYSMGIGSKEEFLDHYNMISRSLGKVGNEEIKNLFNALNK